MNHKLNKVGYVTMHDGWCVRFPMLFRTLALLAVLAVSIIAPPLALGAGGTVIWSKGDAQLHKQEAVASVADSQGNVFVAGFRNLNGNTDDDWWTVKFDSGGNVVWRAFYNPAGGMDRTTAVALDSAKNVIVTGFSTNGANIDIHTIKYNGETGDVIWQRTYAGDGNGDDRPSSIAVDNQDNVYVAGYTRNAFGKHYVLLKYTHSDNPGQDGIPAWRSIHNEAVASTEEALSVAADGNGVAVTGFSQEGEDFDLLTILYTTDGVQSWEKRYDSTNPGSTEDQGNFVRFDADGNVVVTGFTTNNLDRDIYAAKYDRATSNLIWEASYDGGFHDEPAALTLDGAGNVYVTGSTWTLAGNNNYYTVKYDRNPLSGTNAEILWQKTFDSGAGNSDIAIPTGIVVDADGGDVYVTGYTESGGYTDFQTVRYKGDTGSELWHTSDGSTISRNDRPVGIGLSPEGDVLVAGWSDTTGYDYDYHVIRYQAGGLNRPTDLIAQATSLTSVDLSWTDNSSNESGFNVYRWDSMGNQWVKVGGAGVPTVGPNNETVAPKVTYTDTTGVVADTRYDYYVTAVSIAPEDESHPSNQAFAVTTILTPVAPAQGDVLSFDSPDHMEDAAVGISAGPDGKPVVAGRSISNTGGYDYLTMKLDTTLNLLWKGIYGGDTNGTDDATVLAVDNAGDVVVSGYSELDNGTTGNSSQIYTLKYARDGMAGAGKELWHGQFTGTPRIDDRAEAVATAVDSSNNVVVAGRGKNDSGNYDLYVIKYAANANPDTYGNNIPPAQWNALPFDGGGDDQPGAVAFDAAGNIFVAGFTEQRESGSAAGGTKTTIITANSWPDDKWKYSYVTVRSGAMVYTSRITGNTATTVTVADPFLNDVKPGDTYVISNYDWFVAKFDGTTGARIWTDIYDSGYGNDRAYGVAVDPVTNDVYVTGHRSNAAGNTDIHTIKYKGSPTTPPTAEKLWSDGGRSYDGAGHGDDTGIAVRVTPITRRVVVGGATLTAAGDNDYTLIMYNSDGTAVWAPEARVPRKPGTDDYAQAMTVDGSENIYLTGTIIKSDLTSDSMTLQYNHEGILVRTVVYDGANHLNDESAGIAANVAGEVFVAGSTKVSETNTDLLVYKIGADSLQAPYPLTATATYRSAVISWPANPGGETNYTVQRAPGSCSTATAWSTLVPPPANAGNYVDKGLNIGTTYCYRLRSFLGTLGQPGYRESLWVTASATTLAPEAPGTLTATPVNTSQVDLSWTLPVATGHTGFVIERCTGANCVFADGDASRVAFPPLKPDATSFSDSTACAGYTYKYRIATVNRGLSLDNNGNWNTRKPITFTNYQPNAYTRITIDYASPMKTDFSDIRFYDAVSLQELPFWIESKTDGGSALVVVKTGVTDKAYLYYGNGAAQNAGFVSGLVGYWPFNENVTFTGQTADLSGNANTGTLTFMQSGTGIVSGGKFGNGLGLDGANDHVRVNDTTGSSLDITGSLTIETWYQYAPSSEWARIFCKPTTGNAQPWILYGLLLDNSFGAQRPYLVISNSNTWTPPASISTGSPMGPFLTEGNWYHLVGRYDAAASKAAIFVNGVKYEQDIPPVTIAVSNEILGVGASGAFGAYTNGVLDEVRLYNRALPDQEIKNRYNMVASGITLGAAESPPGGATYFDFSPLSWQSVYIIAPNAVLQPPSAPTLGSVTRVSEARLDLSWTDNTTDETGFQIERMCTAGPGCADTDFAVLTGGSLPAYPGTGSKLFSDTGLTPNTTYSYRIRALKNGACGWDNILSGVKSKETTVLAPVITSTSPASSTQLNLAWTDDASSLSGYRVERCNGVWGTCAGGIFSAVGGSPAKSYDDIDACENTDYTYRVASVFKGLSASGGPWAMRAPVAISGFKTNFKTRLTVNYTSPMKPDFSDIRFFDTVANKELPYFIESKSDGVYAVVWVKTGDNDAVYLYYGNRKAASTSNINGVFGPGLKAYWQFEEPAGTASTVLADLVGGAGNSPTISPVTASYGIVSGGVYGNALRLNGSMSATKDAVTLPTGNIASVEAWIRPEGYPTATYNGIVSWGPRSGTGVSFDMCVQNTGLPCLATWGNDIVPGTGAAATLNQWNHIAVVMNGKDVTLYMNNTPVTGTLVFMPNLQSQRLSIGNTDYPPSVFRTFKGYIDEVRVYDRVLTVQDIASSYAAVLPTASVNFAGAEAASAIPGEWVGPYSAITVQSAGKTPAAASPTNLTVNWKSETQLDLSWNDANNDETGFKIERCTDEACCRDALCTDPARKTVLTKTGSGTSYTDSGLTPATTYWYRVRAYKSAGCGWDKGGYGANDVKSGITTVKAPDNVSVTPSLYTNCNDIRFADASGATVYPHWLQRSCNSNNSAIITRVSSLPAGQSPVYLYYGNLTAANASNADGVSEMFDDFQNLSSWTVSGAVTSNAGILSADGSSAASASLYRNFSVASPFVAEVKYQHPTVSRNRLFLTTATGTGSPTGYDYGVFDPSLYWNGFSGVTLTANTWYTMRWENAVGNYTWRILNQSGSEVLSRSHGSAIAGLQRFYMSGGEADASDFKLDWFSVRKLASPTPTTLLDPLKNEYPAAPYTVDSISFYARKEVAVTNGTGSTLSAFPVEMGVDTRSLATDRITIGWNDPSSLETGFSMIRCTAGNLSSDCDPEVSGTWTVTTDPNSGATASYVDTTVVPALRYCYKVKALVPGVTTSYSATAVCANTSVPTKPNGLTPAVTGSRIDLSWSDSNPVIPDGYIVERCQVVSGGACAFNTSDSTFTTFAVDHSQKTFTDPNACSGTYRYQVKSVKPWVSEWPAGYDGPVEASVGVPTAPSDLNAQAVTESQINLTWTDNTTDETKFEVQRCSLATCGDTDFVTLASGTLPAHPGTGAMSLADNTVAPDITYTYRIKAIKEGICPWTVLSAELTDPARTRATRTAPTITATPKNTTRIDLSWTDPTAGETGYKVLRCSDATCTAPTTLATLGIGMTSYSDTGICNSTTPYYYQVSGFKSANLSFAGSGTWTKRAKLAITDFQQDYQTRLTFTVASYLGMQADLRDIRFYDATAGAELAYWVEEISSGVATVYVRTGKNNDIYLYYGNSSATSASSGAATFLLFDDLEQGMGRFLAGNAVQVSTPVKSGSYAGKLSTTGAWVHDYLDIGAMTKGKVTVWYNLPQTNKDVVAATFTKSGWESDQTWVTFKSYGWSAIRDGGTDRNLSAYQSNTWYKIDVEFDTTTDKYKVWVNDSYVNQYNFAAVSDDIRYLRIAQLDAAGKDIYFDNVRVSNYGTAVPAVSLNSPESSAGYSFISSWPDENKSNIASATPLAMAAPTLDSATAASDTQINLSWTDGNSDEAGFQIDRCSDAGCGTVIKTIMYPTPASPAGSYSDTGLAPGKTYYYRVRAYKPQSGACGGDVLGSYSTIKGDTTAAPAPANLTATVEGSNLVDLMWDDATQGDTGFVIQRCTGGSCDPSSSNIGVVGPKADPYMVRYTFNNNLQDSSGNGLHLAGTSPVYEDGGLRLTTSTSYQSPTTSILDTDNYTIEFDFKMKGVTPNAGSWYQVFAYRPAGTDRSPGIWQENSSRAMFTWQHDNVTYSGTSGLGPTGMNGSQFTLDTWYHIKGVKSGANFKVYINGSSSPVAEATVANPKVAGSSPLYFGGADMVVRNFTVTNDAVTKRIYLDSTACSGQTYTYQVRALGGGLSYDGTGCWLRRAKLNFATNSFQANYQTRLTVNISTFTEIKAGFSDIRFYDTVANQEIPYWIEKISTDGNVATVWIKTGANDSIYMYYGNSSASSASNGESVFEFFDDFEGGSINTNKWSVIDYTGFSVSDGKLHGTNSTGKLAANSTFSSGVTMEAKATSANSAYNGQLIAGFSYTSDSYGNKRSVEWKNKNNRVEIWSFSNGNTGGILPANTPMLYRMKVKTTTSIDADVENYDTGASLYAYPSLTYTAPNSPFTLALGRSLYSSNNLGYLDESYATDWDWFRVRKYAAIEPTVTLGAAEDNGGSCFSILNAWPADINLTSNMQTVTMPAPVAPSGLAVTAGGTQAALSWVDKTGDETGFSIERCSTETDACDFSSLDSGFPNTAVGTNITTFTDSGLAYQTTYCYRVRSYRNEACGQWETTFTKPVCIRTTAAPPFNLHAEAQNSFKVLLTWDYNTTAEGFEVERRMPNGMWTQIGRTGATVKTFTDTAGIEPGKSYKYRVRAFYGRSGALEPTDWTQRAFIRNVSGAIVPGEDITSELSGPEINIVDAANGTARITPSSGSVEISTSSTGGGNSTAASSSRIMLKNLAPYAGDFDVQVDYSMPDGQSSSGQWVAYARLHAAFGANYASIYRVVNNGANQYYGIIYLDGISSTAFIPTSETSGKLRIKREGAVATLYVWSGGKWIVVHEGSCSSTPATSLMVLQDVRRLDTAAVRTVFSNFTAYPHKSPYSDEATVSYTNGGVTIPTTPVYTTGASPCSQ
ncbi:MAG: fibronectin I domain-containing [Geobacteraceae bacterium]|nr:MAG: fibronectin I domain-containing [Geobacteraceae bacterium]